GLAALSNQLGEVSVEADGGGHAAELRLDHRKTSIAWRPQPRLRSLDEVSLVVHGGDVAFWVHDDELGLMWPRGAEPSGGHADHEPDALVARQFAGAVDEGWFVVSEDHEILFRPRDELRAGASLAPRLGEKPLM